MIIIGKIMLYDRHKLNWSYSLGGVFGGKVPPASAIRYNTILSYRVQVVQSMVIYIKENMVTHIYIDHLSSLSTNIVITIISIIIMIIIIIVMISIIIFIIHLNIIDILTVIIHHFVGILPCIPEERIV